MVLAYAGGYELIVPLVMLVGLLNHHHHHHHHHHARWRPQRDGEPPVEAGRRGRADT
jgi:hypothetical protein